MGAVWSVGAESLTILEEMIASATIMGAITIAVYWDEISNWFWATFICNPRIDG